MRVSDAHPSEHAPPGEPTPRAGDYAIKLATPAPPRRSPTAQHAHPQRITAVVIQHHAELQITVHDHGGGFDPDSRHAGFGLTGMRERLGLIDGELHITSSPQGTTIHASIPTGHRLAQTA